MTDSKPHSNREALDQAEQELLGFIRECEAEGRDDEARLYTRQLSGIAMSKVVISDLEEQLETTRAALKNIHEAAEHRQLDGVNDRGWISASWVQDRCQHALSLIGEYDSNPSSEPS